MSGHVGKHGNNGTKPARLPRIRRFARHLRRESPVAVVTGLIATVLGLRELFDLHGPGWAKALAWLAGGLTAFAIIALYYEQARHRREVAQLNRNQRKEIKKLDRQHRDELDRYKRNARVAVALPSIHQALHDLRDAAYLVRSGDSSSAYTPLLQSSLQHMAMAFSVVVGAPCRMSVKKLLAARDTPERVDGRVDVDRFSVGTWYRYDGSANPDTDGPSPLKENSDFKQVWEPNDHRWFWSNDLDQNRGYHNPHRASGDPENYDYNAALVWPIQKKQATSEIDLLGFLCVDTKTKHLFVPEADFDLGAAYADSLYTVLAACSAEGEHTKASEGTK